MQWQTKMEGKVRVRWIEEDGSKKNRELMAKWGQNGEQVWIERGQRSGARIRTGAELNVGGTEGSRIQGGCITGKD